MIIGVVIISLIYGMVSYSFHMGSIVSSFSKRLLVSKNSNRYMSVMSTKNLYSVSEDQLKEVMKTWGQPPFRVGQVRSWIYEKGVDKFSDMLDLPTVLRTKLTEEFSIGDLRLASEQISKDGTKKRAYMLHDGQLIESVLMPYEDGRQTACISSQAGCAMGKYEVY